MVVPARVRIAGKDFAVSFKEGLLFEGRRAYGVIDYDAATIQLGAGVEDHQGQCQTLLHEILHGIAKSWGLTDFNGDEDTINKLATGMYAVIVDNPDLFKEVGKT